MPNGHGDTTKAGLLTEEEREQSVVELRHQVEHPRPDERVGVEVRPLLVVGVPAPDLGFVANQARHDPKSTDPDPPRPRAF